MATIKDPAETLKTAEYYLKRIKDLPSLLREKLTVLKDEAKSKRILMLSIQELCAMLELQYSKESFECNCREQFFTISSFLEQMGLKFVPCSIPVDLQFEDPIFIVPKPNLENDEDYAAVKDLLAHKRTPTSKDLLRISNTNEKLANYNIMLRVFEALFVICSNRLGPHQRICLMQIINSLVFPAEGLFYLRACYTFASERRNYHCDFNDKKYCFKPLSAEHQQRINYYLALIAAHGTYAQAFYPDYPYLKDLESEYIKLNPSRVNFLKQQHLEKPLEEAPQTNSLLTRLKAQNHSKMHQKTHLPLPELESSSSYVAATQLNCDDYLKDLLLDARLRYVSAQPLLNFSDLLPFRLTSEPAAPERFIFYTHDLTLFDNFSVCLYAEHEPEEILYSQGKQSFLNYLKKQEPNTQNEELLLLWYHFIALVLRPTFLGYRKAECAEFIANLKLEYSQGGTADLLFIYALHRVLFALKNESSEEFEHSLESDELFRLGLVNAPQLLRLLAYKTQLPGFEHTHTLVLRLLGLRLTLEEVIPTSELLTFINGHFLALWEQQLPERDQLMLQLNLHKLKATKQFMPFQSEQSLSLKLNLILNNLYVKACISPLLVKQNLEHYSGFKWELDKEYKARVRSHYREYRSEYRYLFSLTGSKPELLTKLISGNLASSERKTLQQRLHNFTYQTNLELFAALNTRPSQLAEQCLDQALFRLNLLRVPLESALPQGVLPPFKFHKIILCDKLPPDDAPQLINRLSAGQMAMIILSFILPGYSFTEKLCSCLCLHEDYQDFAREFLEQVRELTRHERPYAYGLYKKFAAQTQGSESFILLTNYLKEIYRAILLQTNYNSHIAATFNQLFELMNIKVQDFAERKSLPPAHSSFKHLDETLIRSKLKESQELQEVIGKLRDEEQQEEELRAAAVTVAPVQELKVEQSAVPAEPALPKNIAELLKAIAAQRSEILDLGEFNGLCLSLKFMSSDAAVEEINDLCYERFDEPLFELDLEERHVYITVDLLQKLCS